MKKLLVFILICFISPYSFALNLVDYNYPQIRGVQIFYIPKKYEFNLDYYMKTLKSKGINTVLFRVFQNNGDRVHFNAKSNCKSGVYFLTGQACMIDNSLSRVVNAAKKYDIKVYAWMATRSLSFLKERYGYESVFERKGFEPKKYGVNIFNSDVRRKIKELFKDLAYYDIQGILIQDDYILKYNEGASPEARKRFYVDYGYENLSSKKLFKNSTYTKLYHEWNSWKMKQLSSFLNEIKTEVKKINPGIKFAVNIYYETPVYPDRGLSWYSQSIKQYINYGFEYLAFMGYHEQISDEMGISRYAAINYVNKSIKNMQKITKNNSRIMVKYQISSFKKGGGYLNKNELRLLCKTIKTYPKISYVAVPFDDLKDLNYICK
jgi:biofilm PGA synthesis lipoprotein PgaB